MFEHNTAVNGGGLFIEGGSIVSINGSEFDNNSAIAIRESTLILTKIDINYSKSWWGASMSVCRSTVQGREMERVSDLIPLYAHCFVDDGSGDAEHD